MMEIRLKQRDCNPIEYSCGQPIIGTHEYYGEGIDDGQLWFFLKSSREDNPDFETGMAMTRKEAYWFARRILDALIQTGFDERAEAGESSLGIRREIC
jgi:hypothetical protein